MNENEWAKYMLECIFEVWFKIFVNGISLYPDIYYVEFINYAFSYLKLILRKVSFFNFIFKIV